MRKILLFFLLVSFSYALDLKEARIQTRLCVKDVYDIGNKRKWADAEIDDYLNQAQREISAYTWAVYKIHEFYIYSSAQENNLSPEYFTMDRVLITTEEPLEETTMAELDKENSTWKSEPSSGVPTHYYTYQGTGTCQIIGFDPPANGTYTVKAYYFALADDLSSEADIPFNGIKKAEPFHYLLVWWAASEMLAKQGETTLATFYDNKYMRMLAVMEKLFPAKPSYFPTISGERN